MNALRKDAKHLGRPRRLQVEITSVITENINMSFSDNWNKYSIQIQVKASTIFKSIACIFLGTFGNSEAFTLSRVPW